MCWCDIDKMPCFVVLYCASSLLLLIVGILQSFYYIGTWFGTYNIYSKKQTIIPIILLKIILLLIPIYYKKIENYLYKKNCMLSYTTIITSYNNALIIVNLDQQ